jgi:hypothetical protein
MKLEIPGAVAISVGFILLASGAAAADPAKRTKPNILIILGADLDYGEYNVRVNLAGDTP